jgi:predicted DNA-binding transcriptional regulator AlpA
MQSIMSTGAGEGDGYLPARKVWTRYGVSDMTLHRWVQDPTMNFPQPIYIGRYRYWRERDLIAFEREPARASRKQVLQCP